MSNYARELRASPFNFEKRKSKIRVIMQSNFQSCFRLPRRFRLESKQFEIERGQKIVLKVADLKP